MQPKSYLKYFNLFSLFDTKRTRDIFQINPTQPPKRKESEKSCITVHDYSSENLWQHSLEAIEECKTFKNNNHITWINIDGIKKNDIDVICKNFDIHYLIAEDILSIGQRPKMDEIDNVLYCLLNMLYFNDTTKDVEQEQISIILTTDTVISIQEDAERDVFNGLREKLKIKNNKLKQSGADYLCYVMLDMIVDHYFIVMEKLGERIELLEERIIRNSNKRALAEINDLRKEIIILKRNITPVRDILNGFIKSDSELLNEKTNKYFKDVHDHIIQATDLVENYRDMMINLQDLYLSNVNLKMNEVMKVMAIVTCLLAPATVIGGIFGMNFEVVPIAHQHNGFYIAVAVMFIFPILMVIYFKKRGWF